MPKIYKIMQTRWNLIIMKISMTHKILKDRDGKKKNHINGQTISSNREY